VQHGRLCRVRLLPAGLGHIPAWPVPNLVPGVLCDRIISQRCMTFNEEAASTINV
jgi:hypothetical protein